MTVRPVTRCAGIIDQFYNPEPKGNPMKSTIRYQYTMPRFRSYKPRRAILIRVTPRLNMVFRPINRFGLKPRLEFVP